MVENNKRFKIMNTYVNAISMEETISEIEKIIEKKKTTQHVFLHQKLLQY